MTLVMRSEGHEQKRRPLKALCFVAVMKKGAIGIKVFKGTHREFRTFTCFLIKYYILLSGSDPRRVGHTKFN